MQLVVWEVHAEDLVCSLGTVSVPGSGFSALATHMNVLGILKNHTAGLTQPTRDPLGITGEARAA